MKIYSVLDKEFAPYGKVLTGYDTTELLKALDETTPLPDGAGYEPSVPSLEYTAIFGQLQNNAYGGMPIQIGWCNGHNTVLNCLEYHRDTELNIGLYDFILLVAKEDDLVDGVLDSSKVKAFKAEAGQVVEVYATTFHYTPCQATKDGAFKVIIVLPKGTNGPMPKINPVNEEDARLRACNKWLYAHKDAPEAADGAYIGIVGENIDIADSL
ncbi:MAG: DUF4867 family protein [Ruminococcaceae bacterium]|nr:DUF4867 family protein [Oscillospiraceae bacterium]